MPMTRKNQSDVMPREVSDVEAIGLGLSDEENTDE